MYVCVLSSFCNLMEAKELQNHKKFVIILAYAFIATVEFCAALQELLSKILCCENLPFYCIAFIFMLPQQYDIWKWISYWINAKAIFVRRISHEFPVNNHHRVENRTEPSTFISKWKIELVKPIQLVFIQKLCRKIGNCHCSDHTQWIRKRINIEFSLFLLVRSLWHQTTAKIEKRFMHTVLSGATLENKTNQFNVRLRLHKCCPHPVIKLSNM